MFKKDSSNSIVRNVAILDNNNIKKLMYMQVISSLSSKEYIRVLTNLFKKLDKYKKALGIENIGKGITVIYFDIVNDIHEDKVWELLRKEAKNNNIHFRILMGYYNDKWSRENEIKFLYAQNYMRMNSHKVIDTFPVRKSNKELLKMYVEELFEQVIYNENKNDVTDENILDEFFEDLLLNVKDELLHEDEDPNWTSLFDKMNVYDRMKIFVNDTNKVMLYFDMIGSKNKSTKEFSKIIKQFNMQVQQLLEEHPEYFEGLKVNDGNIRLTDKSILNESYCQSGDSFIIPLKDYRNCEKVKKVFKDSGIIGNFRMIEGYYELPEESNKYIWNLGREYGYIDSICKREPSNLYVTKKDAQRYLRDIEKDRDFILLVAKVMKKGFKKELFNK